MVLLLTLVPTISNAKSYVAEDTLLSSNVHDYFNNYFSGNKSYQYFGYECGDRTCYYGIDSDNNYINITYSSSSSGYSYDYVITSGVDEDFSVSGSNVFKKEIKDTRVILVAMSFLTGCLVVFLLNRGVYND